ncbi:MAG: DUF2283 domain-containing protein [Methanobrevibacter sp.]|nr:DUF2283 domain-containing protein [Methanobrevibacter sp.]
MLENKIFEVEYEYDGDADAIFIKKKIDYKYKISVELNNNIIMDFDKKSKPVAIEILNASTVLAIDKCSLKNITDLKLTVIVNKDIICVDVKIIVNVHNKKNELSLYSSTTNDMSMPVFPAELATA